MKGRGGGFNAAASTCVISGGDDRRTNFAAAERQWLRPPGSVQVHQAQFCLGPTFVPVHPYWNRFEIGGLVLSTSPALSVRALHDAGGQLHYLLGDAISARTSGAASLTGISADGVEKETAFWAGKWALVSAERCLPDASTCLGIYYREVDGVTWISSSPVILAEHVPSAVVPRRIPWALQHEKGMDWIPGPLSSREGVYKLLPQRKIVPLAGTITPLSDLPADGPTASEALVNVMTGWSQSAPKAFIAMTGGLDSRTVLAAAIASGAGFSTFTNRSKGMSWADTHLPPRLAAIAGRTHSFISPPGLVNGEQAERLEIARKQTDDNLFHPGWSLFASGGFDWQDGKTILALGNVFEVGRCYYWKRLPKDEPRQPSDIMGRFYRNPPIPTDYWEEAISKWIASLDDELPVKMDWRDRFYHEQRLGSWLSTIHKARDLTSGKKFYPANSLWFISLLLAVPPEKRQDGKYQISLIEQLAPELLKEPINPVPLGKKILSQVRRIRRRLILR